MKTYVMTGEDDLLSPGQISIPADVEFEAFDESTLTTSEVPPWEDVPAVEAMSVPVQAIQPEDEADQTGQDGQPADDVTACKLELCVLIEQAEAEITVVDLEIAELSTQLKAAKKQRESKIEEMRKLVVELRGIDRGMPLFDSKPQPPRASQPKPTPVANPWDQWEQGQSITLVRVLVPTQGIEAGAMLRTFDVEPPQEDGDSLSGIVKAFRLNSSEIVELSKAECSPVLPGVKEAPIGQRIQPGVQVVDDPEAWKSVPISSLDLPTSLVEILTEDNSIGTIGELAAWTTWKRLTDLKKVGESKAEKIEEALAKFWASR